MNYKSFQPITRGKKIWCHNPSLCTHYVKRFGCLESAKNANNITLHINIKKWNVQKTKAILPCPLSIGGYRKVKNAE